MEPRRYRINEVLGKGSFGVVYRAELLGSGGFTKPVALKVLRGTFDPAAEIEQRLRDEARLLGMLRHPSVVNVDGLARLPDGWAVVMEYIPGVDSGVLIRRGPLPPRVALEIGEEVSSALNAAYALPSPLTGQALKLVHRDLKPGNLRITAHGEVKILDFGAARAEVDEREASTQAWRFGTPKYMAPERHDGLEGPEGDIYALGIVLAQLLTGEKAPDPPTNPDRHRAFVHEVVDSVSSRLHTHLSARGETDARAIALLIEEMIAFEPESRPVARVVQQRLRALANDVIGPSLRAWAETEIPLILSIQPPLTRDDRCGEIIEESQGQPTLAGARGTAAIPVMLDSTQVMPGRAPWRAAARGLILGFGGIIGLVLVFFAVLRPSLVDHLLSRPAPERPAAPAPSPVAAVSAPAVPEPSPSTPVIASPEPTSPEAPALVASAVEPERARRSAPTSPDEAPVEEELQVVPVPVASPREVRLPSAPEQRAPAAGSYAVSARNPPAEVWAEGGGSRYAPGEVPPGTYTLHVRFAEGQDDIPAVTFSVREGEVVNLSCDASLALCRRSR